MRKEYDFSKMKKSSKLKEITYTEYAKKMDKVIKRNTTKGKQIHESLIDLLEEAAKYKLKGV